MRLIALHDPHNLVVTQRASPLHYSFQPFAARHLSHSFLVMPGLVHVCASHLSRMHIRTWHFRSLRASGCVISM